MNIQRLKGIVWLGSLAVAGGLVFYVVDFLKRKEALAEEISNERLASVLDGIEKPEEQKTDVIDYSLIDRIFHKHDWTGKPPPQTAPPPPPGEKETKTTVAVATILKVLAIKVDTSKPEKSVAYVKFSDQKIALQHTEREDTILRPSERLFAPYQDVRVDSITADGVVFVFDDEAREKETVPTSPYLSALRGDLGIVMVGPGGAIQPQLQRQIEDASPDQAPWRPEQTMKIRPDEWQVGTETLIELDRDYSRILSRDISYSTAKNPRTGVTEGIKVNKVAPGSIPAQAGLTEGEVLKSINGHKVTSVNAAIAFVKANADSTDTWTAVFEKQGREFTRTYHSPK